MESLRSRPGTERRTGLGGLYSSSEGAVGNGRGTGWSVSFIAIRGYVRRPTKLTMSMDFCLPGALGGREGFDCTSSRGIVVEGGSVRVLRSRAAGAGALRPFRPMVPDPIADIDCDTGTRSRAYAEGADAGEL